MMVDKEFFLKCFYLIILYFSLADSNLKKDLKQLSREVNQDNDDALDEFGLPADFDYEVDDGADKFKTLTDQTLIFFIQSFKPDQNKSESKVKEEEIITLMNTRPEVVVLMSQKQLEGIMVHRPGLLRNMSRESALALASSQILADRISRMPKKLLAEFMTNNSFIRQFLKNHLVKEIPLDSRLPAINNLRQLLLDVDFLRMIPLKVFLELAESDFVNFLNMAMVKALMKAQPELQFRVSRKGFKFVSSLLRNAEFVDQLSCATIVNTVKNKNFFGRLSGEDIKVLAKSHHVWKCIPLDIVKEVVANPVLGQKITVNDAVVAGQVLAHAKKIDLEVVRTMLQVQFPQLAERGFQNIFDGTGTKSP